MRTLKLLIGSLALLALPVAGRAQAKIGTINIMRAMDEIDEAKAVGATLKKEMEDRQQKLDAKQDELEKARAEYEKQAAVMTEPAKKEKAEDLQKRYIELNQLADALRREMAAKQDELLAPVTARVNGIVKEVADAEGMQLVVRSEAIFYGAASLDITNEVVRKYNAKYPRKPGPAASAADKPAKATADKAATTPKPVDKAAAAPKTK